MKEEAIQNALREACIGLLTIEGVSVRSIECYPTAKKDGMLYDISLELRA